MKTFILTAGLALATIGSASAQGLKPGNNAEAQPRTAAEQLKSFKLPEGFFGDESADALTIRFADGLQQVIPVNNIKAAGYIEGSSVMPEGMLDAFTDQQVTDLIRYVQSLK